MSAFIIYLLKSIVCCGILYSFYRVAYYNRQHHQWSRFYLVGTVIISLVLPLIEIDVSLKATNESSSVIQLLNVVATNKGDIDEGVPVASTNFDTGTLLLIFYAAISCVFVVLLLKALLRILKIYNNHPVQRINNIQTVMTDEKDTPFSFLHTIFWNKSIDYSSSVGQNIFEHEKVHIQQLHSIDRLFVNYVLTVFWCNPFLWLIKKELIVVHEFMADKKSIKDHSTETLSEMMLLSAFPGRNFSVTSGLLKSSIKRRLTMLTTFNNAKANLIGKWMLMPVILLMFAGFTLRKTHAVSGPATPFTVMIDAGHGGETSGAIAPDGTKEKDLNLSIAKKIRELNQDANIKIVMTRENDYETPNRERVTMAANAKADAFISIHVNRDDSGQSGFELYMTRNTNEYSPKSQVLGSLVSHELKKVYKINGELRKGRPDKGIWVLDAPEINYPSLLIECGNILNKEDLAFVKSTSNQEKIAQQILNAVKLFAENKTSYFNQQ